MASDEEVDESYAGEEDAGEEGSGTQLENDPESEDGTLKEAEEDDDYEPDDGRKRKKGKKRRVRGEEKKGKKKKKKKKNDSGDESEYGVDEENAGDSDYASSKKLRKSRASKHPATPIPVQETTTTTGGMPTIDEVCSTFGLTDVSVEYSESDFQNLTTYKLFQQHVRPLLAKENPKVPMSKLMMLVAAKWREFSNINPHLQQHQDQTAPSTCEPEYSKSTRPRISTAKMEDYDEDEEEEEDEEFKKRKRSSRSRRTGKKASKVPTLKIKLGKRKRGSSVSGAAKRRV